LARVSATLVLAIAAALPLVLGDYRLFQLTQAGIYAIALIGLSLLIGRSGQISLGHGAFYALGAYAAAILSVREGFPAYVAVPAAAVLCLGAGYAFGFPARRLHGLYLALATLALALALPQLLRFGPLTELTGGVQGLVVERLAPPAGLSVSQDAWSSWLVLLLLGLMSWAAGNMVSGRIGRALAAVRDRPLAAESIGIDTGAIRTGAFAVSAFYAGLAGALSAFTVGFVSPDSFDFYLSITLFVGVVVGGAGSIGGAWFGGLFLVFVPNMAQNIFDAAPWLVYGLILIGLMFVMPDGAAGLARRAARLVEQSFGRST